MIKYFVKFIFENEPDFIPGSMFDSLLEANEHGESMLRNEMWNTANTKVVRYVVCPAVILC